MLEIVMHLPLVNVWVCSVSISTQASARSKISLRNTAKLRAAKWCVIEAQDDQEDFVSLTWNPPEMQKTPKRIWMAMNWMVPAFE